MYEQTSPDKQEGRSIEITEEAQGSFNLDSESENCFSQETSGGTKGLTVRIYILRCPITLEVRYVGKTCRTVAERLSQHLRWHKTDHKTSWLKSLAKKGLKPIIEEIECFENSDDNDWQESERFWIVYFRFLGCKLTNMESGGIGGKCHSPETIEKLRILNIGRNVGKKHAPRSEEYRKKIGDRSRGRKASEATKEKLRGPRNLSEETRSEMRERAKQRIFSAETRAKMSAARKGIPTGVPMPSDVREKLLRAHLGVPMAEETKKKISDTNKRTGAIDRLKGYKPPSGWNKGVPSSEETRAKQSASHKARGTGKGPKSQEHREKLRQANLGKTFSEERKAKLRGPRGPNIRTLRKLGLNSLQKPSPAPPSVPP